MGYYFCIIIKTRGKGVMIIFLIVIFATNLFGVQNKSLNVLSKTSPTRPTDQVVWNESRWQDFIDGEIDPLLYVSRRAQLEPDSGCVEFYARFDVDNNGYYDLGCADDSGPYLRLYKGYPFGYSPDSVLLYPITAAGNIDLADLNLDGWAELIHSGWNSGHATIYWGTPTGPSSTNTTELPYFGNSEAVAVYDLDRDTYLDIIIGSSIGRIYIYWGSSSGYSQANRTEVNVQYAAGHNIEIADFDRDGWGDITVALWTDNSNPVIYWGPNRQPREIVWLPTFWNNAHGVTVGDFNRDDWLDIVYQGYDEVTRSYIYFGSAGGFDTLHRTTINPGKCYGGSAAVDWNYDGWLDIVYLRGNWYNGGILRPPVVYLNTRSSPYFTDSSSYELGNLDFNGSGGFVADFNFDGNLDIFINNMVRNDSSYILWGPNYTDKTGLPVKYDHHGVWREPGNIYNRSFSAYYFSSVFGVGPDSLVGSGTISWVAYEPPEAEVHIALRAGDTPIPDSTWTNFYTATNSSFLPNQVTGYRYLQYRATLEYWRPCYLPDLEKISITVNPVAAYDVGVTQILVPVGLVDSGTVITPTARVENFGTRAANFPVTFKIGTNYTATRFKYLNTGQSDTVMFSTWLAAPCGTHIVKCSTALTGDHNLLNDFRIDSVRVQGQYLDVGVTAITVPTGTIDSGTVVIPTAIVRNYSSNGVNFPVTFRIGTGYVRTRFKQLGVNQSDTVTFQPWLAEPCGTLAVKCTTGLSGDVNPANDFQIDSVTVLAPINDVGVISIWAPIGTVDSGTVIIPVANIHNYSSTPVNCPVTFRIGSNYARTRYKQLAVGQSDTVGFQPWFAEPNGTHLVKCTTGLVGDVNPANDFRIDSVIVIGPAYDVEVTQILAPTGIVDSGAVIVPVARVRNHSFSALTFPVLFTIGTEYSERRNKTLNPMGSDTVGFPAWTALHYGTQLVKCSTELIGDENPGNDRKIDSVKVREIIDAATIAILAPIGHVDSGTVVTPVAQIVNYSTAAQNIPVRFSIGANYLENRTKFLSPGVIDTVQFPAWTALQYGTFSVKCSTALFGDSNPSNDSRIDSVMVREYNDAAAIAILAPTGQVDSGAVITPVAQITNYSTNAKDIPVFFTIGSSYSQTRTKFLGPGITDTITFPVWTANSVGTYPVKCSTALFGDENPANDWVIDSVIVWVRIDAGVTEILAPTGMVDSGEVITPAALITNYGIRTANIPVLFRIGTGYSESGNITLGPNETDTIFFSSWTASPVGYQLVKCTTALIGDQNPINDALTDSVYVRIRIDAGVVEILAPTGVVDSGITITPSAVVGNYGMNPANIPVIFSIGNNYIDTNYILLDPGMTDTVSFPTWNAINRGEAMVRCSTALLDDGNPTNDIRYTSVMVRIKDVGTVTILSPVGNIGEGNVIPRARVKNYGTNFESFDAIFKIGLVYTDTIFISNLEPDSAKEINFANWTAVTGHYVVSCSTSMVGDVHSANDEKIDSVAVWRRSVSVAPDSSLSIYSGTSAVFILYATNLGNAPDTVDLLTSGILNNWRLELLDVTGTITLPDQNGNGIPDVGCLQPGQSQGFMAKITSPVNELGNVIDTVTITACSGADPLVQDNAILLTRIIPVYSVLVEPDIAGEVGPNQSYEYELLVKNLGNVNDVVDLSMIHTKLYWKFELLDRYGMELPDRNANGRPDVGPMPALGGETRLLLRVTPDSTAQAGERDMTTVFGESWSDPLIRDSANVQTTVLGLVTSLNVEWDQDDRINAGETKSYQFWAETQGNINDVVDLRIGQLQPEWIMEFYDENGIQRLVDTDGDGIEDLGIMRPGEQKWFTVKIKAPGRINLIGIPDSFYHQNLAVNGIASQNINIKDSAFLRLRTIPNLDVHNYENPFWDRTMFIFSLPAEGNVVLTIYNRAGEKVKTIIDNQKFNVGVHQIPWDGKNEGGKKLVPGTYLYLLEYTDKDNRIEKVYKKTVIANRKS